MKSFSVDMIFLRRGKEVDEDDVGDDAEIAFKTKDGIIFTDFEGCDWKAQPNEVAKGIVVLAKKLKKGDEIVELQDGSDSYWFGILRAKKPKKRPRKKA